MKIKGLMNCKPAKIEIVTNDHGGYSLELNGFRIPNLMSHKLVVADDSLPYVELKIIVDEYTSPTID